MIGIIYTPNQLEVSIDDCLYILNNHGRKYPMIGIYTPNQLGESIPIVGIYTPNQLIKYFHDWEYI